MKYLLLFFIAFGCAVKPVQQQQQLNVVPPAMKPEIATEPDIPNEIFTEPKVITISIPQGVTNYVVMCSTNLVNWFAGTEGYDFLSLSHTNDSGWSIVPSPVHPDCCYFRIKIITK